MLLNFQKTDTCISLNRQLQRSFPFLKLVFYRHSHAPGSIRPASDMLPDSISLGDMQAFRQEAAVELKGSDLVLDVEQAVNMATGLHVQLYRNQYDRWLPTTGTDFETLEQLNEIGLETSTHQIHPDRDLDYREEKEF